MRPPLAPLAAVLAWGSVAFAAPPPLAEQGPVEPHGFIDPCSVTNHEEMQVECTLCDAAQAPPCEVRFGAKGYVKKCATRGGHGAPSGEVWCVDRRPKPEPESSKWPVIAGSVGLAGVLAAAGFYALRRRKPV